MKIKLLLLCFGIGTTVFYMQWYIGIAQMHERDTSYQRSTNPQYRQRVAELKKLKSDGYRALNHDKNLPEAERIFRDLLKQDNANDDAWLCLARIMDMQGRYKESLAFYDGLLGPHRWTSSLQNEPAVLARYAELCDKMGRPDDATAAYREILMEPARGSIDCWGDSNVRVDTNARTPAEIRARAYVLLGIAHQAHHEAIIFDEATEDDSAVKAYRQAVRLQPDLAVAHYYLGYGLKRIGRKREAQIELDRAERLGDDAFRTAMHKRENDFKQLQAEQRKTFRSVNITYTGPNTPPKIVSKPLPPDDTPLQKR